MSGERILSVCAPVWDHNALKRQAQNLLETISQGQFPGTIELGFFLRGLADGNFVYSGHQGHPVLSYATAAWSAGSNQSLVDGISHMIEMNNGGLLGTAIILWSVDRYGRADGQLVDISDGVGLWWDFCQEVVKSWELKDLPFAWDQYTFVGRGRKVDRDEELESYKKASQEARQQVIEFSDKIVELRRELERARLVIQDYRDKEKQ